MLALSQVRSFVAVVDSGSFTEAAQALAYSVPAVSAHVRGLERRIGATLVERVDGRFEATSAGRRAYEIGRTLLRMHDELVAVTAPACPRRGDGPSRGARRTHDR